MQLLTGPLSMSGAKVEIAALEKGLAFERVVVPFDRDDRYQPRHPEVLRINPKQQVPVLIDGDVELFDSTQIFEYLEDLRPQPALWPAAIAARAQARRLEHLADEVFFPHVVQLFSLQDAMHGALVPGCGICPMRNARMNGADAAARPTLSSSRA